MSYTHFIEGTQVYPSGDWEIKNSYPKGCIFARREFSGVLTFGNITHNGVSNDYDYIMSIVDCQRLDYEIKCDGVTYWEGYINHTIGYETDEDNCTIQTEPLLSDEYDCFVIYGDIEYNFEFISGLDTEDVYITSTETAPYDIEGDPKMWGLHYFINRIITYAQMIDADDICGFTGDVVSSFFWLDDYPDSTANTDNYVTGEVNWDEIFLAKITTVRDALGGSGDFQDFFFTFNKVMGWMKDMFNVYWYIDANGDFRLEHLHYYEHDFADRDHTLFPDDMDITDQLDRFTNKPLAYDKNKWKYQSDMPCEEVLELLESDSEDFVGLPIVYDEECTYNYPKKTINTYSALEVFTDIPRIVTDPDAFTTEGLVLVAAKEEPLLQETALLTGWPTDAGFFDFAYIADAITSAQLLGAGAAYGRSNTIGNYINGDTVYVYINGYANAGGQDPVLKLADVGNNTKSTFTPSITADGIYILPVSGCVGATALYLHVANTLACDWSFTDCIILSSSDEWIVQWDTGAITAVNQNNGHLSVANLMDNYWQHGRVLIEGNMNTVPPAAVTTFESVKPNKLQVPINIPKCCEEIHWNTYITTDLGDGYPYSIIEKKDSYEVELLYP